MYAAEDNTTGNRPKELLALVRNLGNGLVIAYCHAKEEARTWAKRLNGKSPPREAEVLLPPRKRVAPAPAKPKRPSRRDNGTTLFGGEA